MRSRRTALEFKAQFNLQYTYINISHLCTHKYVYEYIYELVGDW